MAPGSLTNQDNVLRSGRQTIQASFSICRNEALKAILLHNMIPNMQDESSLLLQHGLTCELH